MADIQDLYTRRVEAAAIALGRGDRHEAERLYCEALVMGDENFGANDHALAVPLNELSRLYVRRSEYARAEPLLHRLLVIRRASGENHADVATVLAGLAAVRRGLGDDVAAEDLYRQALKIREKVHTPDHMAVIVTIEQLADTCAGLRKFSEASALFERALAGRAVALGADHPTARALRERLADMAAQAARIQPDAPRPLAAPAAAPVPAVPALPAKAAAAPVPAPSSTPLAPAATAPEKLRVSGELVFLYEPEKPVRRSSLRRDRVMTPPFSAAVAAASLITVPAHVPPPARVPAPTELAVTSLVSSDPREFDAAIMPRIDERVAQEILPRRSQRLDAPARAEPFADRPRKGKKRYGFAAGGVAVLASAMFAMNSRLPARTTSESSPLPGASESVASLTPTHAATRAAIAVTPSRLVSARPDSVRIASPRPVAAASTSRRPDRLAENAAALPGVPIVASIGSVMMPETSAPNADSVFRATTTRRDTETDQIGSSGRLRAPALAEDRSESSPVLIGAIPQPRFPDGLRAQGVGGDVVVQFLVGTDGTVDPSSMKVVRSPHELFTAAVRNILPRLRFQPARSADAKPRAEWVQYSIQFSATK